MREGERGTRGYSGGAVSPSRPGSASPVAGCSVVGNHGRAVGAEDAMVQRFEEHGKGSSCSPGHVRGGQTGGLGNASERASGWNEARGRGTRALILLLLRTHLFRRRAARRKCAKLDEDAVRCRQSAVHAEPGPANLTGQLLACEHPRHPPTAYAGSGAGAHSESWCMRVTSGRGNGLASRVAHDLVTWTAVQLSDAGTFAYMTRRTLDTHT